MGLVGSAAIRVRRVMVGWPVAASCSHVPITLFLPHPTVAAASLDLTVSISRCVSEGDLVYTCDGMRDPTVHVLCQPRHGTRTCTARIPCAVPRPGQAIRRVLSFGLVSGGG
ncbi:hypothetical protein BHE74_00027169 [Ensete ventricosum]|nr:hypothetical protein BHE74_00027169 [Ensete ventricosum]